MEAFKVKHILEKLAKNEGLELNENQILAQYLNHLAMENDLLRKIVNKRRNADPLRLPLEFTVCSNYYEET